uniref:A-kinase anchor protein 7-like phosphoesterase domain-containing protein n=1 Tax=Oncorhynchus tshawytscha TaxID=74940 RepID=A0A8C8LWX9_ONCTS
MLWPGHSSGNFFGMQSVTGTDYAVELETSSKEHDNDLLLSPAHDPSTDIVAAEESHLHCNVKELIAPENEIVKRIKKRPQKPRGRKQKSKSSECSDNLMSELPFAATAIWNNLGFTKPEANLKKKRKRGRSVQALVMQRDSRLTRALVPVASLHITLLVTHLASQEEVNLAVCAVAQMKASLQDLLRGRELILPFHSIGHFRKVVFCRVGPGREPCQTGPDRRSCEENV